ncbi:MAG: 2-dehydropantoate 2-reductase N-terminal domain-containing protein [Lacunisphaera sp.]
MDWVLVATKAYDAAGAAAWFPGLVGPHTRVAILQNGVEHRERFAPWLAAEKITPVMVDIPAERPSPGRIVQRGAGKMIVPAGPDGARFVVLFAGTALSVSETPDFKTAVWRKLCLNSIGAINALLLKPAGVFRDEAVGRLAVDDGARMPAGRPGRGGGDRGLVPRDGPRGQPPGAAGLGQFTACRPRRRPPDGNRRPQRRHRAFTAKSTAFRRRATRWPRRCWRRCRAVLSSSSFVLLLVLGHF